MIVRCLTSLHALRLALALTIGVALSSTVLADETIHPVYLTEANLEEISRLVESGADVNAHHIAGATALHHLVTVSAQMGLDGLIIRNKKIIRPGQWEATGHEAIAALLVERGANVNAVNASGMTPLHIAALTGHSAAAKFLLARGANPNLRDADGHTPMYWANWSKSDSAIKELAAATGARINPNGVKRRAEAVITVLKTGGATGAN
ncbi:MAG: ankyrin repeat protein [Gammaproteobacteria bacterium]|jgi:ankyrin repeat protein